MRDFKNMSRLVIKIGSSSLVNEDFSVNMPRLVKIMQSFKMLKERNIQVALVSSGAIAVGMHELNLKKKPKDMALKQACAAVGQSQLMSIYEDGFSKYSINTAQILLTEDDFSYSESLKDFNKYSKKNILPPQKPIRTSIRYASTIPITPTRSPTRAICFDPMMPVE